MKARRDQARMDEEEKKDLLDRIDRELGNKKQDETTEKGN
jgi:hypothetical protein